VNAALSNRKRLGRVAGLVALAALPLAARHLPIQVYTSAQGLPQNTVECMLPSATGLLWLCTPEGLVRFDGYKFRVFGPEQGLPSRNVVDMVAARDGGFWLLTERGLCRLPPGSKIGEPCRLLDADPTATPFDGSIFQSERGDTWVSSLRALFHVSGDGRRLERCNFRQPPHQVIVAIADGWDGSLLVATDMKLLEWRPGGEARNLTESLGPIGILCFYRRNAGEYWLGTTAGLYRMWRNGSATVLKHEGLAGDGLSRINAMVRRRDGTVWIAGTELRRIDIGPDGDIVTHDRYSPADGLPTVGIAGMVEDAQGNLWGSTEGSGIFRIQESGFTSYSARDGLGSGRIAEIMEDSRGRLCVVPSWERGPEILVEDGGEFRRVPIRHPESIVYFGWGWNQFVVAARDGSWWVPTGSGILKYPRLERTESLARTTPVLYDEHSALGCKEIFRAWEDPSGDVWITCVSPEAAPIRWQRRTGTFQRWTEGDGMPRDTAPLVYRAGPQDTVWMATASLAIRFRQGRFESFTLAPGRRAPYVRDMLVDSAGRIWFASQHSGLFRCDNPNDAAPAFGNYTVADGLSTDYVSSLVEDAAGYIYAGTARGVDRIDPQAPIGSRRIRHFTAADGLPESQQNTAMRDRQGHLWFGTLAGLAEFDPSKSAHHPAPEVYLTRVRVRGEDVPLPWDGAPKLSLGLPSDRNQVAIEYSAIDLSSPESLLFQYRLLGTDTAWSDPLERLDVNYARLPSGPFHFEVRAMDAGGQVSQQTAGFDFNIAVPLWRRWWFLSGMALLLAAGIMQLYNYRVHQLLAMERLRTRIATDLHDDIGASLTQISILTELARRGSAPQVLSDVANIARELVSDMSDIVWAVNPRHDRFEGLVHRMRRFASDVLGGADIDLEFETDGLPAGVAVPLDARRPLYLVLKEAVNNVARHSGARKATIRLELTHGDLKLGVSDDGRGFDPAKSHSGEGLVSVARRMREIGGAATWDSKPGSGTRFTAVLPLRIRTHLHELMGLPGRARR
jgi:ligand-binding sensor domain-containing protein/two-component sensor histidine kinase